jgi:hypothetical protein
MHVDPRLAALVGFLISLLPLPAQARGGPGAAIGAAIEFFVRIAIVLGFIFGMTFRNWRWLRYLCLCALGLTTIWWLAVKQVSLFILIYVPAIWVLLAVFCAAALVSRSILKEKIKFTSADVVASSVVPQSIQWLQLWLSVTYLYWTVFSLINLDFFAVFPFPLFLEYVSRYYSKFISFIALPLVLSFLLAIVGSVVLYRLRPTLRRPIFPLVFNFMLMLTFLISAEIQGSILMQRALMGRHPQCYFSSSVVQSLSSAGKLFRSSHASFVENGRAYIWSYSELRFVEANVQLNCSIS